MPISRLLFALLVFATSTDIIYAQQVKPYGSIILRYEDEKNHTNIQPRERLRFIARLGLSGELSSRWHYDAELGTGIKDRQNVPAITIHKFSEQPTPPSDIFLRKAFIMGNFNEHKVKVGKIPWQTWQVSDAFWDRDIATIGVHYSYQTKSNGLISVSLMRPIDGESATVGQFTMLHWQHAFDLGSGWKLKLAPWLFAYRGENTAVFAKKDTQYDNTFLNTSLQLRFEKWKLGMDLSHSLTRRDETELAAFKNERDAITIELAHGSLGQPGSYLVQARYHHIERFGVLTEYAQNATQRFTTSNYKGWDLRLRRKMSSRWWLGARLSIIEDIIGAEKGTRFRVEGRYAF